MSHRLPIAMLACLLGWEGIPLGLAQSATLHNAQNLSVHSSGDIFSISGTVSSATTGVALDRTSVSLSNLNSADGTVSNTTTEEDGTFRFEHLRQGKYRLEASRRGYLTARYDEHENYFTAVVVGPDLETENLHFRLFPDATIGGLIDDDAGEPVQGAEVMLFHQEEGKELGDIVPNRTNVTDDTGAYEFTHLKPGNYLLAVAGKPWYSFHPQRSQNAKGGPLPEQLHSALDVAYPLTFYPNTADVDSASPIFVKSGDHITVNVTMHAVPALHTRIRIQAHDSLNPAGRERESIIPPRFSQNVFGMEQPVDPSAFNIVRNDNQTYFEFSGLAPGQYRMLAPEQNGAHPRFAIDLDLPNDETIDIGSAKSGTSVTCKFIMMPESSLPADLRVSLRALDGSGRYTERPVESDGTIGFSDVPPGMNEVLADAHGRRFAIARVVAAGAEFKGNRVRITDQPAALTITLSAGLMTLSGFAKKDGKGKGGIMIVLVPMDSSANVDLFRRNQTDSDGSFTIKDIVPGDYTLIAIENGWTLEWNRIEAVAPYLAHGIRVNVRASKAALDLGQALEVQSR